MKSTAFKIWAVINLTPDSFYPGSRVDSKKFVDRCLEALSEGADVLDIGAESTRPYSEPITAEVEWERIHQPLQDLKSQIGEMEYFKRVSIDTYKPETARRVLETGVGYINDIRGGQSVALLQAVAEFKAGIVLMHSQGPPETMQRNPLYDDVVQDVSSFLQSQSVLAVKYGIVPENIIWDCGIGFGKKLEHNLKLIQSLNRFQEKGYRIMYGISRKSFIDKLLDIPEVEMRRDPTMIIHTYLAMHGVDILRVHDVKETVMIRNILMHLL